ncbi:hypothetical protein [Holdemania massiliensis]|uniref:hypothetical protein n=1 Tax=Holdemania massiliensis TaxID=1468449 RepID=UPI00031C4B65|nr:hypothetical protein [Holdemania massiliensis]
MIGSAAGFLKILKDRNSRSSQIERNWKSIRKKSKKELYFHLGAAEITSLPFERKTAFFIGEMVKEM